MPVKAPMSTAPTLLLARQIDGLLTTFRNVVNEPMTTLYRGRWPARRKARPRPPRSRPRPPQSPALMRGKPTRHLRLSSWNACHMPPATAAKGKPQDRAVLGNGKAFVRTPSLVGKLCRYAKIVANIAGVFVKRFFIAKILCTYAMNCLR
jgi:hypothetical protein